METSIDRIPIQLTTFLDNEQPLVISDYEESFGSHKVLNVLPKHLQRTEFPNRRHTHENNDNELYPDEQSQGWRTDRLKNIPGFRIMLNQFSESKWFIMIDDDTYIFKNNLIAHLLTLDDSKPLYIGHDLGMGECGENGKIDNPAFAQGGAGIVLSRPALVKMVNMSHLCEKRHENCFAGDMSTSLCLRDAGVYLNKNDLNRNFHDISIQKLSISDPCDKPFSFHHLRPLHIKLLHDLEVEMQAEHGHNALINVGMVFKYMLYSYPLIKYKFNHNLTHFGLDLVGGDYEEIVNATLQNCQAACLNDLKCLSWSFVDEICKKKDGMPIPVEKENVYSGWFEDKLKCKIESIT